MKPRIGAVGALLLLLFQGSPAAAVTFFDGDFAAADYNLFVEGSGTVTPVYEAAGGSPGAHLRMTTRPSVGTTVSGSYLNANFVYDPSTAGAIGSLQWSVDHDTLAFGQAAAIALSQGGSLFFAGPFATTSIGIGPGFVTTGPITVLAGDLPAGLDASAGGAPITFGLLVANTYDPVAGDVDNVVLYDNLTITVNAVPEPRRLGLLLLAPLVFAARGRR